MWYNDLVQAIYLFINAKVSFSQNGGLQLQESIEYHNNNINIRA